LTRAEFNGHARRKLFSEYEPSTADLPPELAIILNNAGVAAERETRSEASLQVSLDAARILHDAGIPILAGTDQVVPGFSIARELELLVRAGLPPMEAIRSATTVPARMLNVTDSADIAPGKRADLVVLDADPLRDIRNIRTVHLTIVGGKAYEPNRLRQAVDIRPRN
jgi:imidazolonepropionase-like amidohydrolase